MLGRAAGGTILPMTTLAAPSPVTPRPRFANAAEWLRALGGVPLERIVFDPWPGSATEADLLRFVERDKRLCELVDGTLVEKPVGYRESVIASRLAAKLTVHCDERGLGLVSGADSTMRMRSGRIRLPDVAFVSKERVPLVLKPVPDLSPDLAVEVLSESNTADEIKQKLREYFQSGTRLAWIVDSQPETAAVYRNPDSPVAVIDSSGRLDGEEVVPGFSVALADLFKGLPPVA